MKKNGEMRPREGGILRTAQISVWIRRMVIEITGMSVYPLENVHSTDMVHRGINLDNGNSTKNKLQRRTDIFEPAAFYFTYEQKVSPRWQLYNIYYSENT